MLGHRHDLGLFRPRDTRNLGPELGPNHGGLLQHTLGKWRTYPAIEDRAHDGAAAYAKSVLCL